METLNIPNISALVNEMKIIDDLYNWSRLLTGERKISKEVLKDIAEDTNESVMPVINQLKYVIAKILLEKLEVTQDLTSATSISSRVWGRLSYLMSEVKYSIKLKKMRRAEKQIKNYLHQHQQIHWEMQYAETVMERKKRVYLQNSTIHHGLPPYSLTFMRMENEALVSMKSAFDAIGNYNSFLKAENTMLKNLSESVERHREYIFDKMQVSLFLTTQNVRSVLKECQLPWANSALKAIDVHDPRRVAEQIVSECSKGYTFKKIEHSVPNERKSLVAIRQKMKVPCKWLGSTKKYIKETS